MTKVKKLLGIMLAIGILLSCSVFSASAAKCPDRHDTGVTVVKRVIFVANCHPPANCSYQEITYKCNFCGINWTVREHVL
jgi:hypothetical protein